MLLHIPAMAFFGRLKKLFLLLHYSGTCLLSVSARDYIFSKISGRCAVVIFLKNIYRSAWLMQLEADDYMSSRDRGMLLKYNLS